ncbi:preprotein translocase, SecE subunit [Acidothermus cellulolyticus 11B]|uniref:Protein translocase subunit SecE n=1 Tax=Acidothermus cellulolyticus (strain ATCC 43068 / DSM 8971 / 11B) TaxID=351607 RepID=A0LRK7_ACIC1|nr:preprotein translocase, SecE subunit [Acidothermus cellulolyticus 11B]
MRQPVAETTPSAAARRRPERAASDRNVFERIGVWYRQIVAEMRKVIWPTRRELVTYTIVTVVFAVVMIAIVAGLDYGANWAVLKIFG